MKAFNIHIKTVVASIFIATINVCASAEEKNVVLDIPVVPMNTSRIEYKDPEKGGVVSNAVDQAILDAVSKSMPAESIDASKQKQFVGVDTTIDSYGRTTSQDNPPPPKSGPTSTPIAKVKASTDPVAQQVRKKYKAHQLIKIKPGNSELVPVAVGLQNRIATPFKSAVVKTSDIDLPVERDGGYIYITPMSQAPIGLLIGEEGMPETMVNITLMPLDVPPVMIDVKVDMNYALKKKHKEFIEEAIQKEDHEEFITEARKGPVAPNDPRVNTKHVDRSTSLLSTVAAGELPAGFDMLEVVPVDQRFPCDITRMTMYHEVGQRLISGREIIDVVLVKNDINGFREIREEFCLADDVIAVGVFDRATLAPGESAEVYILRDKLHNERLKRIRVRPRLTSKL